MTQKARNLEVLKLNGIAVPTGFTLSDEYYSAALEAVADQVISALPSSQRISEIFLEVGIPEPAEKHLQRQLSAFPETCRFAVRSSGAVFGRGKMIREDSANISLAGQFESFLNVPRSLVAQAVLRCWTSLFNERSIASFEADRDYVLGSVMSVVIQEMIPARASAVIMTVDPLGDGKTGAIEFTLGPCEALVAGLTSPDEAIFHRDTCEIVATSVGSKIWQVAYGDFIAAGENANRVLTATEDRSHLSLSPETLRRLVALGLRIEGIFGVPQDIEIVITDDENIVVTQARAITTLPRDTTPLDYNQTGASS